MGAHVQGGCKEAWSFKLGVGEFLLVGGRTLGEREQACRPYLEGNKLRSDWCRFEAAYKGSFLCKAFSNSQGKVKGTLVSREKGAHSSRGAFLKEPFAKLERSLQSVTGSFVLYSLLYLLLEELHMYTSL